MAGVLAALDGEFVVRRARLPRLTPFPSWNGVLGANSSGLLSIFSECGAVYLLRLTQSQATFEIEESLEVFQILEDDAGDVMTMCQAWAPNKECLVVARDHQLTVYRPQQGDEMLSVALKASLRFAVATLDVLENSPDRLLIAAGCAVGVMLYSFAAATSTCQQLDLLLEDIAVSVVSFSPDGHFLGVGTVDGRVIMLHRSGLTFSGLDSQHSFIKVLAAPRVTSITFSPYSDQAIVTTRKGNVYILARTAQAWALDAKYEALTANPKGGATSQTLSCWWGTEVANTSPIFVLVGRSSSCSIEMYDAKSCTLLHTLKLTDKNENTAAELSPAGINLHVMGVTCVPSASASTPPQLVCLDSDAALSVIEWPFLTYACPR